MSIWRALGTLKWDGWNGKVNLEQIHIDAPDWDALFDSMARYELSLDADISVDWTELVEVQRTEKINTAHIAMVNERKEYYHSHPDQLPKAANENRDHV